MTGIEPPVAAAAPGGRPRLPAVLAGLAGAAIVLLLAPVPARAEISRPPTAGIVCTWDCEGGIICACCDVAGLPAGTCVICSATVADDCEVIPPPARGAGRLQGAPFQGTRDPGASPQRLPGTRLPGGGTRAP